MLFQEERALKFDFWKQSQTCTENSIMEDGKVYENLKQKVQM